MDYHQMLHNMLSLHRAGKETLKILPATEEYRGLRGLIVRVNQKIEKSTCVRPEQILQQKES